MIGEVRGAAKFIKSMKQMFAEPLSGQDRRGPVKADRNPEEAPLRPAEQGRLPGGKGSTSEA